MPEKPEVVTTARKLKKHLLHRTIQKVDVYHANTILSPSVEEFVEKMKNRQILDITTRGKWIVFDLGEENLLIHLRMEGKFFYRTKEVPKGKHEHVIFTLDEGEELRFHDVRKFGKMVLLPKQEVEKRKPLGDLGLEFDDEKLDEKYLKEKYKKKTIPIKTALLDQRIIAGIGNIYADEILFQSRIFPLKEASRLTSQNRKDLITNTRIILTEAINEGGTTIRSYTSEEGVHGLFQQQLKVHGRKGEACFFCGTKIVKITVGGRGTYYCPKCQKEMPRKK